MGVGENMKQLEISAEKAQEREEKLKDKIHQLMERLKVAEARYEYGEMNIYKLNLRIDDIEDEIYREKLKIKKVSDELNETFDDMLENSNMIWTFLKWLTLQKCVFECMTISPLHYIFKSFVKC